MAGAIRVATPPFHLLVSGFVFSERCTTSHGQRLLGRLSGHRECNTHPKGRSICQIDELPSYNIVLSICLGDLLVGFLWVGDCLLQCQRVEQ